MPLFFCTRFLKIIFFISVKKSGKMIKEVIHMGFVPLHIRSGYSFLKSGLTMDRLFHALEKNHYASAALCDIRFLYGLPSFVNQAKAHQMHYGCGVEVSCSYFDRNFSLCFYAQDEEGYKNLIQISSYISHHDFISLEENSFSFEHIITILSTESPAFLIDELIKKENERLFLAKLTSLFPIFYLGLESYQKIDNKKEKIRAFAKQYSYRIVAFPLISYLKKEDAITLSIVEAIEKDMRLDKKEEEGLYYLRSLKEEEEIYTLDELALTEEIASSMQLEFYKKRGHLLLYHGKEDSKTTLKEHAIAGLKALHKWNQAYEERLNYELSTIESMGFSDYFLIVEDYVSFAKKEKIPVGPGRGSAAASLVAYALNITTIDPLKYHLLFESFLNPARVTMPDIDIDFGDIRRDEVVTYLRNKYGNDRVSHIVTFQTMGAKQSLRDIGRVYAYPNSDIDLLAKAIGNYNLTLREAYKKVPAFRNLVDSDPYYLSIVSLASKIEGLPRQAGIHAAGVILNEEPLTEVLPVTIDSENRYTAQYEMNPLAEQGFLKMDILGLRNLTLLSKMIEKINENHALSFSLETIPYDEKEIFSLIAEGKTMGLFQLESSGIKRAIQLIEPSSFDDVVAVIALFRPGPMSNIPTYAKRKKKEEPVTYFTESLKEILAPTYGIIVYQEQVLEVVKTIASFSLSKADLFRRAISKKDANKLEVMEKDFIEGALQNGYSEALARKIYDHILKFADYGFKKAHSVAYSVLACQLGYMKVHYPLEFYAVILEGNASSHDNKYIETISEIKSRSISLLLPNVMVSTSHYEVYQNSLLLPLTSIQGVTSLFVNELMEERKDIPFTDFFDFVIRMYTHKITSSILDKLIYGGALDCFSLSRSTMISLVPLSLEYASLVSFAYEKGKKDQDLILPPPSIIVKEDNPLENCEKESEVLGFMLSETPLKYYRETLKKENILSIHEANSQSSSLRFAGILKTIKTIKTKKGNPMAFLLFFDDEDEKEVVVFPEVYAQIYMNLNKNQIYIIEGRKGDSSFIANQIIKWRN